MNGLRSSFFERPLYETEKLVYNTFNLKMGGMAMGCMKCGRDVEEQEVFCPLCLAQMERYPVRPGTVVLLPRRRDHTAARKIYVHRKQAVAPEEQVKGLRRMVFWLTVVIMVLSLLLGVLVYPAVSYLADGENLLPGQNYSTMEESAETENVSRETVQ